MVLARQQLHDALKPQPGHSTTPRVGVGSDARQSHDVRRSLHRPRPGRQRCLRATIAHRPSRSATNRNATNRSATNRSAASRSAKHAGRLRAATAAFQLCGDCGGCGDCRQAQRWLPKNLGLARRGLRQRWAARTQSRDCRRSGATAGHRAKARRSHRGATATHGRLPAHPRPPKDPRHRLSLTEKAQPQAHPQ